MTTGMWFVGLFMAIGVVLIAGNISAEFTNAMLLLILVGIVLFTWDKKGKSLAPLVGLVGKVAGGESPKNKA